MTTGSLIDPGKLTTGPADEDPESSGQGDGGTGEGGGLTDAERAAQATGDPFGDLKEFQGEDGLYLGKYKTLPDVFKGYKELTAKLREKTPEPPEKPGDYAFEFQADGLKDYKIPADDPEWGELAPVFHQARLSNEQAQAVVEAAITRRIREADKGREAARQELGSDADKIVADVSGYGAKLQNPEFNNLAILAGTDGKALRALHALIAATKDKPTPARPGMAAPGKTAEEWQAEAVSFRRKHQEAGTMNAARSAEYDAMMLKSIQAEETGKTIA